MKRQNMKIEPKSFILYFIGCIFIAFGVVLMTKSNIGNSSWDTLHYSLEQYFLGVHNVTWFTMGVATIVVALTFTFIVIILNRDISYLLMTFSIFIVGAEIDLFFYLLRDVHISNIFLQVPLYIAGGLILPLGGTLLIVSTFPAGIFDEFNLTLLRLFKTTRLALVRGIMELLAVGTAIMIGFQANIGYGKVNIGTLIFSVSVGYILRTYL